MGARTPSDPATVPTRVHLAPAFTHGRREVERFIHARFAAAWGDRRPQFLPLLMSLRDDGGL